MMKNAGPVCQKNASQFTTCQKRILIGDFDDKAKKMKIAMCNKLLQKNNITKYIIVTLFNSKDVFSQTEYFHFLCGLELICEDCGHLAVTPPLVCLGLTRED